MHKEKFIEAMITEDVGRGDLYARIEPAKPIRAYILAKSNGVFGGAEYIETAARMHDLNLTWHTKDGATFVQGDRLLEIHGDSHALLALERSLLDIALHAS